MFIDKLKPGILVVLCVMTVILYHIDRCYGEQQKVNYKNLTYSFYDASFLDPLNGWICGKSGFIYRTKDGGLTWEKQNSGVNDSVFDIAFQDANRGLAVGQRGLVLITDNGGESWDRINSPVSVSLLSADFFDSTHGIAVGDWGKILYTDDSGKSWADISLGEDVLLYSVCMIDENEVWISAEMGMIFHTLDGGMTWEKVQPTVGTLFAISFDETGKTGIAVGIEGVIVVTRDGGKTWIEKKISRESLYNVELANGHAIAIGDAGTVYSCQVEDILRCKEIEVPINLKAYWLQGLEYVENNRFFIIGANGSALFVQNDRVVMP